MMEGGAKKADTHVVLCTHAGAPVLDAVQQAHNQAACCEEIILSSQLTIGVASQQKEDNHARHHVGPESGGWTHIYSTHSITRFCQRLALHCTELQLLDSSRHLKCGYAKRLAEPVQIGYTKPVFEAVQAGLLIICQNDP